MTDTQQEQEDLSDLVQSPGWLRVMEYAERNYGTSAFGHRVLALLTETAPELARIQRIKDQMDAVQEIVAWPSRRLKQLSRP